jgi:cob(I)alamin adenosyltransferase
MQLPGWPCRLWPGSHAANPKPENTTGTPWATGGEDVAPHRRRRGDGLGDGTRVADSARIEAIGRSQSSPALSLARRGAPGEVADCLTEVQHDLFDLGGELSIPGYTAVREVHVDRMEEAIGRFNADLAPLKEFILPGGTRAASLAHAARTVCRRAERALVRLGASTTVSEPVRKYVNRLSDLLFVLARVLNREAGRADVLWRKDRRRAE